MDWIKRKDEIMKEIIKDVKDGKYKEGKIIDILIDRIIGLEDIVNEIEPEKICNHCNKSSTLLLCTSCRTVFYCNAKCQRKDWAKHKNMCVVKK